MLMITATSSAKLVVLDALRAFVIDHKLDSMKHTVLRTITMRLGDQDPFFMGLVSGSVAHRAQLKHSIAPPHSDHSGNARFTAGELLGTELPGQGSKSADYAITKAFGKKSREFCPVPIFEQ